MIDIATRYTNLTANGLAFSGPGIICAVTNNKPGVAGTIVVYDGISVAGAVIGTYTAVVGGTVQATLVPIPVAVRSGCFVAVSAGLDVTILWRKG